MSPIMAPQLFLCYFQLLLKVREWSAIMAGGRVKYEIFEGSQWGTKSFWDILSKKCASILWQDCSAVRGWGCKHFSHIREVAVICKYVYHH